MDGATRPKSDLCANNSTVHTTVNGDDLRSHFGTGMSDPVDKS